MFGARCRVASMTCSREEAPGAPLWLISDRHTPGLLLWASCQNPTCDFHIVRTSGLCTGISGEASRLLVRWCVEEERTRAWSRSMWLCHLPAVWASLILVSHQPVMPTIQGFYCGFIKRCCTQSTSHRMGAGSGQWLSSEMEQGEQGWREGRGHSMRPVPWPWCPEGPGETRKELAPQDWGGRGVDRKEFSERWVMKTRQARYSRKERLGRKGQCFQRHRLKESRSLKPRKVWVRECGWAPGYGWRVVSSKTGEVGSLEME